MTDLLPWLPAIVGVIGGLFGLWSAFINRGGQRRSRREPTWAELLNRVTTLEEKVETMRRTDSRKMQAVARILRALFDQWPSRDMPNLDPADIAEIEDTIPPAWVRRKAG